MHTRTSQPWQTCAHPAWRGGESLTQRSAESGPHSALRSHRKKASTNVRLFVHSPPTHTGCFGLLGSRKPMVTARATLPLVESRTPLSVRTQAPAEPKSEPPRPKRRIVLWVGLAALGVLGAFGVTQVIRVVRRPPEVVVVAVQVEEVTRLLAVTGRVEAAQTVMVGPQFAGRITEIVRHEGERVKKGEVLCRLADTSAKSDVVQQEAALSSKQQDLIQARRDLARTSALVAGGAIPGAELESSQLLVSRAIEDVRRLSAVLSEGKSQLVLLAPFDGMIIRRNGEVGQVVGAQSALFEIATVESARVSAEVDERYVRALRPGMRAEILPVGAEDGSLAAVVSYLAQAVDPQTGAATVRFAYAQMPKDLLLGMSVDVNVSVESIASAVTIPREAVGGGGEHPFVLIVSGGRVEERAITVDDWPASIVVVRSGLEQGELTLLDPKGAAVGAKVRSKVTASGD